MNISIFSFTLYKMRRRGKYTEDDDLVSVCIVQVRM